MTPKHNDLIAQLSDDLEPVAPFAPREGAVWVAASAGLALTIIALVIGLWNGIFTGEASAFFWITNGLLLVVGLAATSAVLSMGNPCVGNRNDAPFWTTAMLSVLPLAALITAISGNRAHALLDDPAAAHCLMTSMVIAGWIGAILTVWLRKGAPVSLNRAGWMVGISSGALGTLIYGMSCPADHLSHLAIAHVLPVFAAGVLGRLVVPHLLRW